MSRVCGSLWDTSDFVEGSDVDTPAWHGLTVIAKVYWPALQTRRQRRSRTRRPICVFKATPYCAIAHRQSSPGGCSLQFGRTSIAATQGSGVVSQCWPCKPFVGTRHKRTKDGLASLDSASGHFPSPQRPPCYGRTRKPTERGRPPAALIYWPDV